MESSANMTRQAAWAEEEARIAEYVALYFEYNLLL
jgi:hypothetical protein